MGKGDPPWGHSRVSSVKRKCDPAATNGVNGDIPPGGKSKDDADLDRDGAGMDDDISQRDDEGGSDTVEDDTAPIEPGGCDEPIQDGLVSVDGAEMDDVSEDPKHDAASVNISRKCTGSKAVAQNSNEPLTSSIVFMKSTSELEPYDIIKSLEEAESGAHLNKTTLHPPIQPKAGSVFLYQKRKAKDDRFLEDQYNGFRWTGRKKIQKSFYKTYYKMELLRSQQDKEKNTGKIQSKRIMVNFRRITYMLINPKDKNRPFVLIHYLGDESLYRPQPHGNAKHNRPYTRTSRDTKEKIKLLVQDRESAPKKVYEKVVRDHFHTEVNEKDSKPDPTEYELIDTPRDIEQVKNFKKAEEEKTRISKCEIFSLYEMANTDLETFILKLQLKAHFCVIIAEPKTITIANQLLKLSRKQKQLPQLRGYDTTFELADAFVSILVMRHTAFHGNPIFPVAFMIHDRRLKQVHEEFWLTMRNHLDVSSLANVPIWTDREAGIMAAIKGVIPEANLICCTNHIKRDIRFWLINHIGGSSADISVLSQNVSALLEANNITEYGQLLDAFQLKWTSGFLEYFQTNLQTDVFTSARFNVKRFAAFEDSLPTNNISESLNFVIKCHNKWKELRIDTLVLKFIEIQCANLSEFIRATRNLGRFRIKEGYHEICKLEAPSYLYFKESDFAAAVKESAEPDKLLNSDQTLPKETYAKRCVELRMVTNIPDQQMWVVRSPYNNKTYNVHRNTKEAYLSSREFMCNCDSQSTCWHILAVKISIGDAVDADTVVHKLSVVKKKSRGTKRRLGRKKPDPNDLIANVMEAEDSELAMRRNLMDFEGVRNIQDNSDRAKSLFVFDGSIIPPQTEDVKSERIVAASPPLSQLNCLDEYHIEVDEFEAAFQQDCPFEVEECDTTFSKFPSLKLGEWIEGSYIDRVISALMRQHVPSNMIYFGELLFQTVWTHQAVTHVSQYSHQHGGLNKDIALVCVSNGYHWMLGVIMVRSKTICLFDSLFDTNKKKIRIPVFQSLLNITKAMFATAFKNISKSEWTFLYASDSPRQTDGTECGVIVCMMVFALFKGISFPSKQTLDEYNHLRNRLWMLRMLRSEEANQEVREHRRFPPELKTYVSKLNTNETVHMEEIQTGNCLQLLLDSLDGDGGRWTICNKSCCSGDSGHNDKQILCVLCRTWFHLTCLEKVQSELPDYYICDQCSVPNNDCDRN